MTAVKVWAAMAPTPGPRLSPESRAFGSRMKGLLAFHGHEPPAGDIVLGQGEKSSIEQLDLVDHAQTNRQQRIERLEQQGPGLGQLAHAAVEVACLDLAEPDAERLEMAANGVGVGLPGVDQPLADRHQRLAPVGRDRTDMHGFGQTELGQLRQHIGVRAVALVRQPLQDAMRQPGADTFGRHPQLAQPVGQPARHRSRLQHRPRQLRRMLAQQRGDRLGLAGTASLEQHLAASSNNTDLRLLLGNVQSGIGLHGHSPDVCNDVGG